MLFAADEQWKVTVGPVSADVRAMFEGPCALVVGGHDADGAPVAAWAWGVAFSDLGSSARLVVEGDIRFALGCMLAITCGDLFTTRSVQLKGSIANVERPSPDDLYRVKRHIEAFRRVVAEADGIPRERIEGMWVLPSNLYTSYVVGLSAVFEQSPGPRAGARLGG